MPALHESQDLIGPALHREVEEVRQLLHLGVGADQTLVELHRMRGGEPYALDTAYSGYVIDLSCEICCASTVDRATIGVHILTQEIDLLDSQIRES